MFNSYMISKIVFFSICLVLCCYQVYQISEMYFKYETTTAVKYDTSPVISVPGFTLCFNKKDVIKPKYINETRNSSSFYDWINKFKIRDQFEMLLDYNQIFKTCLIWRPNGFNKTNSSEISELNININRIAPIKPSIEYFR